jgi:hypothetical protein
MRAVLRQVTVFTRRCLGNERDAVWSLRGLMCNNARCGSARDGTARRRHCLPPPGSAYSVAWRLAVGYLATLGCVIQQWVDMSQYILILIFFERGKRNLIRTSRTILICISNSRSPVECYRGFWSEQLRLTTRAGHARGRQRPGQPTMHTAQQHRHDWEVPSSVLWCRVGPRKLDFSEEYMSFIFRVQE